jgi:hypothetical protein
MDMDLAVAKLNLAGIAMSRRRKMEATALLNEAKKLRQTKSMLKDQINNDENLSFINGTKSF